MIFLVACLVGYAVEEIWCFIRHGYFESRHSLIYGPLSVLYGMGAVLLTVSLYKIKDSKWYTIFLTAFVVCSAAEYIASLGQELLFGSVAWDYSNVPLNINGRICLLYSLFWGVLGLAWIKGIYPVLSRTILEETILRIFDSRGFKNEGIFTFKSKKRLFTDFISTLI